MISKQTLKDYEFKTIEDYFNYIIESLINGNYTQLKELLKKLGYNQKKQFCYFLNGNEIIKLSNDDKNKLISYIYIC